MTNVSAILDCRLNSGHRELLGRVSGAAAHLGVRTYLVGGSVRDLLMGNTPAELDMAIASESRDAVASLMHKLGGIVMAESQFGTAKVETGGVVFDAARTRRETYARPGALPTVEFVGSIEKDLPRRDFTMNAAAVSLDRDSWGALLDPFGGRRDLEANQVRVLHRTSFIDDPTRILRAVRYAGRLGFGIEGETGRLLDEGLDYLDAVSGDRIRRELEHIFAEERVAPILDLAEGRGVPRAIHPALAVRSSLLARLKEGAAPSPPGLAAALAFDASDSDRASLVQRLALVSDWGQAVRDVGKVKARLGVIRKDTPPASKLYALLADLHDGAIEACALASNHAKVRRQIEFYLRELRGARPMLDGRDVMALGVPEGPPVGETLRALLNAQLDGLVSTKEDEKRFVRQRLGGG